MVVVGEEVRASEYDVEECKIRRSCSCVVLLRRNKYILPSGSDVDTFWNHTSLDSYIPTASFASFIFAHDLGDV